MREDTTKGSSAPRISIQTLNPSGMFLLLFGFFPPQEIQPEFPETSTILGHRRPDNDPSRVLGDYNTTAFQASVE
jgi:hypothetical protein